ncbi:MAG TPA: MBL fold metallo-hydrolase [Mesotoga infera]|jgi:Cft2 family RNA processing exonuclease|nr:MBL fold metallo-hydrolase [Mesotoga infera]HPD39232.1 MBL fold metallo-hydrolase [Mesotoga infera]HRV02599.1 MBL fold metallo-hydrolase [Mesotoga sp.]
MEGFCFTPLGGANSIGESCYLFEVGNAKILVDAGLGFQERPFPNNLISRIDKALNGLGNIDLVLITHAHRDHLGSILKLMANGYSGYIYSSKITKQLAKYVFDDIIVDDLPNREIANLYAHYASFMYHQWHSLDLGDRLDIKDITIWPFNAGHIAGSFGYVIEYDSSSMVITGDASLYPNLSSGIMNFPNVENCELLICDGTAVNKENINLLSDWAVVDAVEISLDKGEKVIFPCVALGKDIETLLRLEREMVRRKKSFDIFAAQSTFEVASIIGLERNLAKMRCKVAELKEITSPGIFVGRVPKQFRVPKSTYYDYLDILPSKKSPSLHYFSIGTHLNSAQIELLIDFTKPKRTVFVHTLDRELKNAKFRSPSFSIAQELRKYGRGDYPW